MKRIFASIGRFFAAFGILTGFLLVIAAGGFVAGLLGGVEALAVFGGLFLVALLVLAREEGLLWF